MPASTEKASGFVMISTLRGLSRLALYRAKDGIPKTMARPLDQDPMAADRPALLNRGPQLRGFSQPLAKHSSIHYPNPAYIAKDAPLPWTVCHRQQLQTHRDGIVW